MYVFLSEREIKKQTRYQSKISLLFVKYIPEKKKSEEWKEIVIKSISFHILCQ